MKALSIRYQTAENIPAPYCHEILFHFVFEKTGLKTNFQMAYHDREELSEEEVLEEGFTLYDNFAWKGILHANWAKAIQDLWEKTAKNIQKTPVRSHENYLEIEIDTIFNGRPSNQEPWEYLLQELTQAVFETAQKENFLSVTYRQILPDNTIYTQQVNVFFQHRRVEVLVNQNKAKKETVWEEAQKFISLLFIGEFYAEDASDKLPQKTGRYLHIGDGLWYEMGKSLKNPHGNIHYAKDIAQMLALMV